MKKEKKNRAMVRTTYAAVSKLLFIDQNLGHRKTRTIPPGQL
jgi:hypothetical protein